MQKENIIFRIEKSKKEEWKRYCKEKGITLTSLIINSVEGRAWDNERKKALEFIEKQGNLFAKVENNINQQAKFINSQKFMTKEQISVLKRKKNGAIRKVIAYFSIGEAGNYRSYWKEEWNNKSKRPNWIVEENPYWKGDFIVKYWSNEWKQIVKDYQKKLDEIGVDGYLLDTVDTYYNFEDKSEKTGKIID